MISNTLSISVERGGRLVRFNGDLNFATVDEARMELRPALANTTGSIILDLRSVGLLASMGIELLLEVVQSGPSRTCVLLVNENVADVLRIAGVTKFFRVARTEREAERIAGL